MVTLELTVEFFFFFLRIHNATCIWLDYFLGNQDQIMGECRAQYIALSFDCNYYSSYSSVTNFCRLLVLQETNQMSH